MFLLRNKNGGASNEYHQHMFLLRNKNGGASNEYPQHMFLLRNKKIIMWIPLLSGAIQLTISFIISF